VPSKGINLNLATPKWDCWLCAYHLFCLLPANPPEVGFVLEGEKAMLRGSGPSGGAPSTGAAVGSATPRLIPISHNPATPPKLRPF
jgi:hypothetical protein